MTEERGIPTLMQDWVAACVAMNSNYGELSSRNGSVNTKGIQTLGEFLAKDEKDPEQKEAYKDDMKLMRHYVVPVTFPNGESINLIVDSNGRDVAQITVDGEFELDKTVEKGLKNEIMKSLMDGKKLEGNEDFIELAKEATREMPSNPKELGEAISKGKLDKTEKNRDKAAKEKPPEEKTEEEFKQEAEDAGLENVDEIVKICQENGLNPADIKQSMEVVEPNSLADDVDMDKAGISTTGGTVTVLRFKNRGAETNDKIFMIQDGKLLPSENADYSKVEEIMTENGSKDSKVHSFEDKGAEESKAEIWAIVNTTIERVDDLKLNGATQEEIDSEISGALHEIDVIKGNPIKQSLVEEDYQATKTLNSIDDEVLNNTPPEVEDNSDDKTTSSNDDDDFEDTHYGVFHSKDPRPH